MCLKSNRLLLISLLFTTISVHANPQALSAIGQARQELNQVRDSLNRSREAVDRSDFALADAERALQQTNEGVLITGDPFLSTWFVDISRCQSGEAYDRTSYFDRTPQLKKGALDKAVDACHLRGFRDCAEISYNVTTPPLTDTEKYLGYARCQATATVRGHQ